jgi:Lipase (class 3)
VIAIRGTDTQHQWLEDFRAIAQPVAHGQWWMHQGFDDVWNSISASLQKPGTRRPRPKRESTSLGTVSGQRSR